MKDMVKLTSYNRRRKKFGYGFKKFYKSVKEKFYKKRRD